MAPTTASDVMTTELFTVTEDTPIRDVARLFYEKQISGVPVVTTAGALRGLITEADILVKQMATQDLPAKFTLFWSAFTSRSYRERLRKFEAQTAGQLMTADVHTARPEATVHELALTMMRHDVNRIPIVQNSKLVGIVSRRDVLKVFLRSDTDLDSEIERARLAIDGLAGVSCEVRDGIVVCTGKATRRSALQEFERIALATDGVVAVEVDAVECDINDLGW